MASISVTTAQVQARLGDQAYKKLFAQNGQSSVDATWLQTHLDDAIAEVEARLRKHFGDELPNDLVVHPLVIRSVIAITCANAAQFFPGGGAGATPQQPGPYQQHRDAAEKLLEMVSKDLVRPTLAADRPRPRATISNDEDADGNPTNPFTQAADLRSKTLF